MVGGYATNLHGYQRFTGDLDIWLKDDLGNSRALRKTFVKCNIGDYPMIDYMQFAPGWTEFYLNNECLQMASIANIEDVAVPFLHINQLIENKKVVNRPKDQLDVIALEEIRKLRDNSQES